MSKCRLYSQISSSLSSTLSSPYVRPSVRSFVRSFVHLLILSSIHLHDYEPYQQYHPTSSWVKYIKADTAFCHAGGQCQTRRWRTFFKTFIQKLPGASVQIQSWLIFFQRKWSMKMTILDFAKFQTLQIVVQKCCYFFTEDHILRRSFTCDLHYSMSTRGSLMISIRRYHH